MFLRRMSFVLLVLAFVGVPSYGQEKATLEWKFEKDKVFYQTMTTKTNQTMKVMNADVKQDQDQTFYFSWTVTKVDGDKVELKQKIIGVVMKINIAGTAIEYDSTKTGDAGQNPLAEFFKALIDAEFTYTYNKKDSKVEKIDGRDAFVKKLTDANPQMKPLLEKILSEKALTEMAEPTFAAIPGGEKKVGDSWNKTTTLDMGPIGTYTNNYKYTFDGFDSAAPKVAKIKIANTLTYKPGESNTGGLPFKITNANLNASEATGNLQYDTEKGRVKKSEMTLKLTGDLSIDISGQTTKVNLEQTQTTNIETSDENPLPKK